MQNSTTSRSDGFAIQVVPVGSSAEPHAVAREAIGSITIGPFSESFPISLNFWAVEDYVASWKHALAALEESADSTVCLVASMVDPQDGNFVNCWPVYRSGDIVRVQNSIIFFEDLTETFDPGTPWLSVAAHSVIDEDGNRISEWSTTMSEIRRFRDHGAYFADASGTYSG
ncbi:hypothetical protein QLQ12_00425 [Actinoplanes sp. NEAU-A12]|uniref:CdiI C-terminal domain-containing protein n=1 Tax=Actinoplanes sandaracinus TaxID=3045177 RepID=A0ABT6WBH1_9ACTN|nr:hypothetical protein [Actinoplanes sandaracinus]MDI6097072.1 hypothetical protein [Actinoplanes sandaracinus]